MNQRIEPLILWGYPFALLSCIAAGDFLNVAGADRETTMLVNTTFRISRLAALLAGYVLALALVGCSGIEKAKPRPEAARINSGIEIDVPEIMRGTVASETVVLGYETPGSRGYSPIVARGYGLVVGLNGTGSRDIPPDVRAYMLAEARKQGVGSHRWGDHFASMSPEALLDSLDTAVVIVEAIIPQGAVKGTRFDVRVVADPRTGTTSLEGGRLYTTLLRPGPLRAGGAQAFELAEASGPVFVNPFAEPGAVTQSSINRLSGRILNGGVVTKDLTIKLRLANPSHARAAILCSAINTRFPQERGQRTPTARGESDELIELTVPPSFADHTDEFIELLRHTTIAQSNPEAVAMSIKRSLLANPMIAEAAALRWRALGKRVLPLIKDLYDYPEEMPRMAALYAGAKLDDGLVIPHLISMARNGTFTARQQAIGLLSEMRLNPMIDQSLRELLYDDDVEIRLDAYEALVKRGDPYMHRYNVDGKYLVDVVQSDKPMIYITQSGQPRIVLFGEDLAIERPATIQAWSNRIMLKADAGDDEVEVYYRPEGALQGSVVRVTPTLSSFARFLGHTTSIEEPEPGLGLSYGEAVGVLHQIWSQRYIKADFKADQDRILAAIMRQADEQNVPDRPEFSTTEGNDDQLGGGSITGSVSDLGRLAPPMAEPPGGWLSHPDEIASPQ